MSSSQDCFEFQTLSAGTELYHFSENPAELVREGVFRTELSRVRGMVFFGLGETAIANCIVTVRRDLTIYRTSAAAFRELQRMLGNDYERRAHEIGIDGRICDSSDICVKTNAGGYVPEVTLFPGSLFKLGQVERV